MPDKQLVYMYVIADKKKKDDLIAEMVRAGGALISSVFGYGFHESRSMFDFMGFAEKKGKVVISCLISRKNSTAIIETLNDAYGFSKPGTGIAFTVPVEQLVY